MKALGKALALVMLLALVGAGSATAAKLITGADVANGSLTGADIENGTVKKKDLSSGAKDALQGAAGLPGPAGPAGSAGPAGPAGPAGEDGGPNRYAEVSSAGLLQEDVKNIDQTQVDHPADGTYCFSFPEGDRPTSGAANGTSSDTLVMLQIQAGGGLPFGCPAAANVMIRTYDVGLGIYQDNAFRLILSNNWGRGTSPRRAVRRGLAAAGTAAKVPPRMTLRELLGDGPEVDVVALAYDNRAVVPGTLFFCVPGFTRDGHDFAPDAVARGAAALVVQRPLGLGVPEVLVDDVRAAMARAAARFHGDPTAELDVVGITGTSGKTTTTYLVRHAARGRRPAVRPARRRDGGGRRRGARRRCARRPRRSTCRRRSGRCSTPATAPARWRSPRTRSSCAASTASTSPSRRSPTSARTTSTSIPTWRPTSRPSGGCSAEFDVGRAIVVVDDAWGRRLAAELPGAVTVSLDGPADWQAAEHCSGLGGNAFTVRSPAGEAAVELPLRGRFNAANALVAMAAGDALGLELGWMAEALRDRRAGAGPRAGGRGGAGLRAARRLRAQAGRAGEGAAVGARAGGGPGDRRVRRGRRPRPREAAR